ncbi:unnamed protein product [Brugia timori]|uniref:Group-specific protein n=1 Tax=Brugia timori TaxID=42155 RepID=A0A0R3Q6L6_9BILA|nr:unnamed protein product [Brugia timori]
MKYPSISLSWKHEETLQLFELMETEDDWLVRIKKLVENFGDERPAVGKEEERYTIIDMISFIDI